MKKFLVMLMLAATIYTMQGNSPVNLAWDDPGNPPGTVDHYEVYLVEDVSNTVHVYKTTSTNLTISIPRPSSGVFMVEVRAVGKTSITSDWCQSTDPNCALLKDGVTHGAWKVFWKPPAPSGGTLTH